jgi:putative radical SAM enzyme (TIGR03279 family)
VEQRLSPLYLSIHSTNKGIRDTLLGNPKAPDVMKELAFFKDHKIRMHCQIVLCPGYNDGTDLRETIRDLYRFYPYVASIAVVPVGLTAHRKTVTQLRPVEKDDAVRAIETIETFQKRFTKRHGDSLVYGSDELYIRAAAGFPSLSAYGELPQIENGVGMVTLFFHQARRLRIPQVKPGRRFLTFSGVSFYPFLGTYIERLRKAGMDVEALPIENSFFGASVTVTGLLTGRDVVKRLAGIVKKNDTLLIPDVVMREGEAVFLDDVSRQDIEGILGIPTHVIASTPRGLLDGILSSS